MSDRRPAPPSVAQGLWRLALLQADGVACFAATPEGLLASFAPWLAIGITLALLQSVEGHAAVGLSLLLQIICLVLAAPVLSHVLLRLWRQDAGWLRFSTVYVWSQWLPNALALLLLASAHLALSLGIPPHIALTAPTIAWFAYALRLNWLVTRTALGTGWVRTLLLLLWIGIGVGVILVGPTWLTDPSALSIPQSPAPGQV